MAQNAQNMAAQNSQGISARDPSDRARQLLALTQRLAGRLEADTAILEAHRPQDLAASIEETRTLSNLYRFETTRIKADPKLLAGITPDEKQRLIDATQVFQDNLQRYEHAVGAAKTVTEGIVTAIAAEMQASKANATTYGDRGVTRNTGPQSLNIGKNA
jgi:hypothetical protein